MSVFVSRLSNRNGIDWPSPGTWQQGDNVSRLETFAKNLDISQSAQTDLLNSVPTPWARLLLFEAALYDDGHPAHSDVEDQWRGLLGVLALHQILRLRLDDPRRINLRDLPQTLPVRNAFLELKPRHVINNVDQEAEQWHRFDLISVDGAILGATSPRTLVFTGISHGCPDSIPFCFNGRLSDPVSYFQRFGDNTFLGLLAYWLDTLIQNVTDDQDLIASLGTVPNAPGGQAISRHTELLGRLQGWRAQITSPPLQCPFAQSSQFEGVYSIIKSLRLPESDSDWHKSDLFLRGHSDVLVCFQRGLSSSQGSSLVHSQTRLEIANDNIRIYDGHWIEATQPLPVPLSFVPRNIRVIENPSSLFEDFLIEAKLKPDTTYSLNFDGKHFLLPYKKEVLDYLSPRDIVQNTVISKVAQANRIRVEFALPLQNNRTVIAYKEYREDDEVITESGTANLAFWPDFVFELQGLWRRYFYYKLDVPHQIDFQPLAQIEPKRVLLDRTWFMSTAPLPGFIGTVDGKQGLLLIKYQRVSEPTKYWKVSVDLGSTHTRAFSVEAERQDDSWCSAPGAQIRPIRIAPNIKELTECQPINLMENFVDTEMPAGGHAKEEFTTQLVMPQPQDEDHNDWLPREGFMYFYSLLEGFPTNEIKYDLKWNSNTNDYTLRAFLRCLLLLAEAQAIREGAKVVSVSHAYPSVFSQGLVLKHGGEWAGLANYSHLTIESPLMESEAVGRHLQVEQGAAVAANTIALDVGGSTTDIALWTSNNLSRQESVKMAAGVVGRYVQTERGPFKKWLVQTLKSQPFSKKVDLDKFENRDSGYSLMFNAALNEVAATGQLNRLIKSINTSQEGQPLIAHIMFVFAALIYYVGLLGRKTKMTDESRYYIYFCGKGGQLITWIPQYEEFIQEMFAAGLQGPQPRAGVTSPTVVSTISRMPKEEVGRGLLAESRLAGANKLQVQGGLLNLAPPTVTVGEEGYSGLNWDGELDGSTLLALPRQVPAHTVLKELNAFVESFAHGATTKAAARLLGLGSTLPARFVDNLKERLFGSARGRIIYDLQNSPDDALLEPLFVTEVKVLLETLTDNPNIFA